MVWISVVLMSAAFAVFMYTFKKVGSDMSAHAPITILAQGVIALVGWTNRFLIAVYCAWVMTIA